MNGKRIRVKGRRAVALLLALLILSLTAIPALAWEDECCPNFRRSPSNLAGLDEGNSGFLYRSKVSPRIVPETPALRPSLAQAE